MASAVAATAPYPAASFRPIASPRRAGPARSIFMITVVDQVSPWLMPSSTLAATTQPQFGAQISSSGTGSADQPAGDQHRLAAVAVGQGAGEEVGDRLDQRRRPR